MSGGGGTDPSSFQLPGWKEQGSQTRGDINTLYSQLSGLAGQYAPVTAALGANPYAGMSQQGAGTASTMGMGQGQAASDAATQLYQQIQQGNPFGIQALQTAFDPQNALYNRTQQQLQDQVRSSESARGIAMSPYGAGLEDKAMSDFNIDWQNQQLGRQTQGLGAWTNFLQGQGGAGQTAAGLGGQGTQLFKESSALPYNTYSDIQQGKLGALGAQAQALGLPQTAIADMMGYLNAGNAANANALSQEQINNDQTGGMLGLLGGGLGFLSSPVKPWFL